MNLNLLLIITAVILLCMVVDGYKKGMVKVFQCDHHSAVAGSHRTGTPFTKCGIFLCKGNLKTTYST